MTSGGVVYRVGVLFLSNWLKSGSSTPLLEDLAEGKALKEGRSEPVGHGAEILPMCTNT